MKTILFLFCTILFSLKSFASSELIDLKPYGYQVLDKLRDEGEGGSESDSSDSSEFSSEDELYGPENSPLESSPNQSPTQTPFAPKRSLPMNIPQKKKSSRAQENNHFEADAIPRPLGIQIPSRSIFSPTSSNEGKEDESRKPEAVLSPLKRTQKFYRLSKGIKDRELFKEFDSETPQLLYHKGLDFQEFSEIEFLTVKSKYLNQLHFYKIESELQIKNNQNHFLNRITTKEMEYTQTDQLLVFSSPGKLMSEIVRNQMKDVFKKGPYQADYILFKIRLFTRAIDDLEVSVDLLIPLRFQYEEGEALQSLQSLDLSLF